jgi:hypothetical protein
MDSGHYQVKSYYIIKVPLFTRLEYIVCQMIIPIDLTLFHINDLFSKQYFNY